jgi:hypothetical protein
MERLKKAAWSAARLAATIALPFFLLVNGSVMSHRFLGTPAWTSILLGSGLATAWISLWGTRLWRRMTGRARVREIFQKFALPIVLVFSVYSLGWVSNFAAKSDATRSTYQNLHPTLRLALGTATLIDPDVVITGIARERADYARMGLRPVHNSLHFEQQDGWIHAVDLRTRGRGPIRNLSSQLYFRLMGFRALRHGGSGDHLHIALPRPRRS